jgi:hypothetical protein
MRLEPDSAASFQNVFEQQTLAKFAVCQHVSGPLDIANYECSRLVSLCVSILSQMKKPSANSLADTVGCLFHLSHSGWIAAKSGLGGDRARVINMLRSSFAANPVN